MVLITGASGLLGHALALRLADEGEDVRVLLRNPVEQSKLFRGTTINWVAGSLENVESLERAVDGVKVIYHCAATSTDWAEWDAYYSSNVKGVENLLYAASQQDQLCRFLHVSSTDVYGYPKEVCGEEVNMVETNLPYNKTKIAGEKLVQAAGAAGMPVTIIRPATIFGPGDYDFVHEVYHQLSQNNMPLIAGGKSTPGLLFISNAVEGIIAAARSDRTIGKIYNLRDETEESWADYIHAFADEAELPRSKLRLPLWFAWSMACTLEFVHKKLGWKSKPLLTRHTVYLMTRNATFPIDRAKSDFGFRSIVKFNEAVAQSVAWVKSQQLEQRGLAIMGR